MNEPQSVTELALFTITSTTKQVEYVLANYPSARKHDGVLVEKVLQLWPLYNARCIYNSITKNVELVAPYENFIYLMKHISTITRTGREVRHRHPEWNGASQVDYDRKEEEKWSRAFWAVQDD